jgi:lysophospholipase L1-like esterase
VNPHVLVVFLASLAVVMVGSVAPAAPPAQERVESSAQQNICRGAEWLAAWTAAPSDAGGAGGLLSRPLIMQTARMVVRPTVVGRRVRIRLSNEYGPSAARVGAATIAQRLRGAAAVPGSMRRLTFGGRSSVVIAAGATVTSDPVRLAVRPGRDLLVSLHLPGVILQPTQHFITNQTNYLSIPGNHAAADVGAYFLPVTGTAGFSNGWYFLSGVDIQAPRSSSHAVVSFGDSITDGFQGSGLGPVESPAGLNGNARYPNFLAARVLDHIRTRHLERHVSVVNAGISGNQVLSGPPGIYPFGRAGVRRFRSDVLQQPGVRDVIILEGINDLGNDPELPPRRVIEGIRRLVLAGKRAGLRVHLGTLTPSLGASGGHGTANTNTRRHAVNRWIRRQHVAESVIDFDAALRDPQQPDRLLPAFDSNDHLHPSTAGYRAMAAAVPVRRLLGPSC